MTNLEDWDAGIEPTLTNHQSEHLFELWGILSE